MSETRHVNKYKIRYGGTTTANLRTTKRLREGQVIERIVDKVIREWRAQTAGQDGNLCRTAAQELAHLFKISAEDKP